MSSKRSFFSGFYTKHLYEILVFSILSVTPLNSILLISCPSNTHTHSRKITWRTNRDSRRSSKS